jgi:hypothetical protein
VYKSQSTGWVSEDSWTTIFGLERFEAPLSSLIGQGQQDLPFAHAATEELPPS